MVTSIYTVAGDCEATGFVLNCELVFNGACFCGAINRFELDEGECNFNKLFSFYTVFCLFLIKCFIEL